MAEEKVVVDMDIDGEGDEKIIELKENVKSRQGRGFDNQPKHDRGTKYEALTDDEDVTGPGLQRSIEGWIIFIRNIHEEATEEEVRDRFYEFGEIKNLHLNFDRRTGNTKGYIFIEYETFNEAQNALKDPNKEKYGKKISVDLAFVKGPNAKSLAKKKNSGNKARSRSRSIEHKRH